MIGNFEEKLGLENLAQGELNEEFKRFYQMVRQALAKDGDKGSVNITVTIGKIPDSATMYEVGYSITPKFPGKRKGSICQVNGDGELLTDKVKESNVKQFTIFDGKAAK